MKRKVVYNLVAKSYFPNFTNPASDSVLLEVSWVASEFLWSQWNFSSSKNYQRQALAACLSSCGQCTMPTSIGAQQVELS